ncbi:hypothetical protein NDU88_000938 [Pleurodeles waltl]|uniref:Uncharacterized protein n=1 Tax=Pleurodeles waltl TaxID=8319 RepID=A0AAV7TGX9_PLEWA|nr:hypothetical protein NDU88_000938 [Pleurodeles waltl]
MCRGLSLANSQRKGEPLPPLACQVYRCLALTDLVAVGQRECQFLALLTSHRALLAQRPPSYPFRVPAQLSGARSPALPQTHLRTERSPHWSACTSAVSGARRCFGTRTCDDRARVALLTAILSSEDSVHAVVSRSALRLRWPGPPPCLVATLNIRGIHATLLFLWGRAGTGFLSYWQAVSGPLLLHVRSGRHLGHAPC